MGCTPSQSSTAILVEQRPSSIESRNAELSPEPKHRDDSFYDSPFKRSFSLEEEGDDEMETGLQASMQSSTSQHSSKSSNCSWDSGVYELDEDYSHVITENSDPNIVRRIDSQFIPPNDIDLCLEGKACPKRVSARNRDLMDQQAILEVLRNEGLIVRPPSRAAGGIRFEFVSAERSLLSESSGKLPPLIKRKPKRKELTHEEIQQKLLKAEERRRKMTEDKLSKATTKDRLEIQMMAQKQAEENRQKMEKKLQETAECRAKHLQEVQEKLKSRQEYAQKVRERKQMLSSGLKYICPSN